MPVKPHQNDQKSQYQAGEEIDLLLICVITQKQVAFGMLTAIHSIITALPGGYGVVLLIAAAVWAARPGGLGNWLLSLWAMRTGQAMEWHANGKPKKWLGKPSTTKPKTGKKAKNHGKKEQ